MTRNFAHQILLGADAIGERDPLLLGLYELRAGHQFGEVELPIVRWMVWTIVVTELALVTVVDDIARLRTRHLGSNLFVSIDRVEKARERGAQRQTTTTIVAFLEDTGEFPIEVLSLQEFVIGKACVNQLNTRFKQLSGSNE